MDGRGVGEKVREENPGVGVRTSRQDSDGKRLTDVNLEKTSGDGRERSWDWDISQGRFPRRTVCPDSGVPAGRTPEVGKVGLDGRKGGSGQRVGSDWKR